ncbi:hypothetical protein CE91St62_31430 [Lachnospiraceae bacterium]|nr:hypothetical protein CE91St61_31560 [Lachnospiraceae bacterium]BDF39082.1 hypothetical protein CE91St62_31430 [Lachnospiraceae bacterium]
MKKHCEEIEKPDNEKYAGNTNETVAVSPSYRKQPFPTYKPKERQNHPDQLFYFYKKQKPP